MQEFNNAKWIWNNENYLSDEYVEFKFHLKKDEKINNAKINIAVDSNYNLLINGKIVAFGQYADYPTYKVYDTVDITEFLTGNDEIDILVWYYGIDTQNYIKDKAGAIFEVFVNGECVEYSGKHIVSRLSPYYVQHRNKTISSQLGLTFAYLNDTEKGEKFSPSVEIEKSMNLNKRPNDKLLLQDRVPVKTILLPDGSYLVDMDKETCGFIDLDVESGCEQNIIVAYGEFLDEGKVRRIINTMDFSVECKLKRGENKYVNCFRRLSGRYLQIFTEKPIKINYVGLRPVEYPVVAKPVNFKKPLHNQVYETCLRTLHNCMHEHYEDTPWREQALYTMDGRNEMLCTYFAYGDYKFARSNIVLISKGLRSDGLLSICYPAGRDIPIPSFSLIFAVLVYEYIKYSGDKTILREVKETLDTIAKTFISKIEDNGLIAAFPYPYWNYYEWSKGSSNGDQISRKKDDYYPHQYDLILNCMFLWSMQYYKKLCAFEGEDYIFDENAMANKIRETFYDDKKGLYKANDGKNVFYSVLGNSFAVLSGVADKKLVENILKSKDIVPVTLAMSIFFYDALLAADKRYAKFIIDDIDERYGRMLQKGATTFWETEEGASSLTNTGSLCHGWSATPIYYYSILNSEEYFNGEL